MDSNISKENVKKLIIDYIENFGFTQEELGFYDNFDDYEFNINNMSKMDIISYLLHKYSYDEEKKVLDTMPIKQNPQLTTWQSIFYSEVNNLWYAIYKETDGYSIYISEDSRVWKKQEGVVIDE